MKKIITLLLTIGAFTSVFAQTQADKDEARRVILGQPKNKTSYPTQDGRNVILGSDGRRVYGDNGSRYPDSYPNGSAQQQIDQINREYNNKIYSIRNNPTLSSAEKERMIRQLENDRNRRIQQINNRYNNNNNNRRRYDDDDDDYKKEKKHGKGNNGNHYGWEKGKGNPHRSHN